MRFLFDFGFGALAIEQSAILSLYETLVEIVEGANLCRRAYCQSHDHSHTGVTLFCPPHGRADLPATKMRRQTWWRKLLYRSHFSRAPISQGVAIICPDHSVSFFWRLGAVDYFQMAYKYTDYLYIFFSCISMPSLTFCIVSISRIWLYFYPKHHAIMFFYPFWIQVGHVCINKWLYILTLAFELPLGACI